MKIMIVTLVIVSCTASWVEPLPWSVWPFGVGQMRQNYAPVVWPDEMAVYHPVYRRHSAFHPQQLRLPQRPLRKTDPFSNNPKGPMPWIDPASVEMADSYSSRGREVATKSPSGGIIFAGQDDSNERDRFGGHDSNKQGHHRTQTRPTVTPSTTTPPPSTTSEYNNNEPVNEGMQFESEPFFNVSECQSEQGFCEQLDDYPSEAIASIVQSNLKTVAGFFNLEKDDDQSAKPEVGLRISPVSLQSGSASISFTSGVSAQEEDLPLCDSQSRWVEPKKAKNVNNQWMLVVNQENMTQGIWTEKCWQEDSSCKYADNFPVGYRTVCKQKYSNYKLVAINELTGKMQVETFKFPTCCSCHVRTSPIFQRSAPTAAAAAVSDVSPAASSNRRVTTKAKRQG